MSVDKLFGALNISASGLSAQRKKLEIISSNIANVETTKTKEGGPYRRKIAVLEAKKARSFDAVLRSKTNRLATTNPRHISGSDRLHRSKSEEVAVDVKVTEDQSELRSVYDPGHPDADENGYVRYPNVNMISEMVDMINASRSYEANVSSIDSAKKIARAALDI